MEGSQSELTPEMRRGIVRWIRQTVVGVAGYGLVLFLAAGRLDWWWGWAFYAMLILFLAAHPLILMPRRPDLLVERQKGVRALGVKRWDRWITIPAGGLMVLTWIVAGLDFRFGWSGPPSLSLRLVGLFLTGGGYALFLWAMAANPFFSEGVRIQTERGHVVVSDGPYRFVRHPGYVGVIIAHLATPILLGSSWALLPGGGLAVLFVLRTHLEDHTLHEELPGYEAYARAVPNRLLPGLW